MINSLRIELIAKYEGKIVRYECNQAYFSSHLSRDALL